MKLSEKGYHGLDWRWRRCRHGYD